MLRNAIIAGLIGSASNFAALSAAPAPPAPQEAPAPAPCRCNPFDELAAELSLDSAQSASVTAILEERRRDAEAAHATERRERERAAQVARAKLSKILSPQQLARFDNWDEAHRPPPPPGPRLPPPPPDQPTPRTLDRNSH